MLMIKKEVLIITKNKLEYSPERVMDWINHFGHDWVRLNGDIFEQNDQQVELDDNGNVKISGRKIEKNFFSLWYWRWSNYSYVSQLNKISIKERLDANLLSLLREGFYKDNATIAQAVISTFNVEKYLTNIGQVSVNKLSVLQLAKKCKLLVPRYIITNNLDTLKKFRKLVNKSVVTKDVCDIFYYYNNEKVYSSYVEEIDDMNYDKLPDNFALSFFQERIEKDYEVRAFILKDKIYSMAVFSQKNVSTQVDYRKYNSNRPNRCVPYQLPFSIETKLIKLLDSLKLNTGSVDLIKDKNGKYYFLEVNPVGQFGVVSEICNFNIEKEIALYLISE